MGSVMGNGDKAKRNRQSTKSFLPVPWLGIFEYLAITLAHAQNTIATTDLIYLALGDRERL